MTTYVRTMRQLHALPGLADVPDYSRSLSRAEAVLSFGEKMVKAAESEGSVGSMLALSDEGRVDDVLGAWP